MAAQRQSTAGVLVLSIVHRALAVESSTTTQLDAPSELSVNGIHGADLSSAPFPTGGAFLLSWLSPLERASSSSAPLVFEVALFAEHAALSAGDALWSSTAMGRTRVRLPTSIMLAPDASYWWRVRLATGRWSPPCFFDTAPAEPQWGNASWIGGGSQLRTDWNLPAGRSVVRARAYVSGLGAFQLHVNGAVVGDHMLDPGQSVYDQKTLYVCFNLTQLLRPANHIGALVGNSKWGYLDIYSNRTAAGDQSGDASRAFLLLITAVLDDGSVATLRSGAASWRSRHGPIVYDHMWHGEIYDARREVAICCLIPHT